MGTFGRSPVVENGRYWSHWKARQYAFQFLVTLSCAVSPRSPRLFLKSLENLTHAQPVLALQFASYGSSSQGVQCFFDRKPTRSLDPSCVIHFPRHTMPSVVLGHANALGLGACRCGARRPSASACVHGGMRRHSQPGLLAAPWRCGSSCLATMVRQRPRPGVVRSTVQA